MNKTQLLRLFVVILRMVKNKKIKLFISVRQLGFTFGMVWQIVRVSISADLKMVQNADNYEQILIHLDTYNRII